MSTFIEGEYPEKEKAPASTEASSEPNITPSKYTMPCEEQMEKGSVFTKTLYDAMKAAVVPFNQLNAQGIPLRRPIMGDWFKESDYGIIYAQRGVGKTWFSMGMASALNSKDSFGPWAVHDSPGVLYVDGEMPAESIHQRMEGMGADGMLLSLNHEVLHHKSDRMLNLAEPHTQKALTQICLDRGIKVLFLDNLSSLVMGVGEDKADEWEKILVWFLGLRKQGVSVVLVLHAGRSNQNPRGTSRREDGTEWVIKLDKVTSDAGEGVVGARFVSRFEKNRNAQTDPPDIEWHFQTDENGKVVVRHRVGDPYEALIDWVKNGLTSATDIAKEMGVAVGTISKLATKAIKAGKLCKDGRGYTLA